MAVKISPRKKNRLMPCSLAALIGLLSIGALAFYNGNKTDEQPPKQLPASVQRKQTSPVFTFTPEEAVQLFNQLLVGINPDNSENAYMSSFMGEQIRWVYVRQNTHQLSVSPVDNSQGGMGGGPNVYMRSSYHNGFPIIEVSANHLMEIQAGEHLSKGFNQKMKNGFALALIHEAVHLARPQSFFTKKNTKDELDREELRACRKVDRLAVMHLLKIGQPLHSGYEELHKILEKCGDTPICPAFEEYNRNKLTAR